MVQNSNYINIQGWMVNELGLKGTSLLVYAIIYGFSQDGESKYTGSRSYLAEWCGCTVRSIQSTLNDLVENGLLTKEESFMNGVKFCSYTVNCTSSEKISLGGGEKISLNKLENNKLENNILSKDNIPETDEVIDKLYNNSDLLGNKKKKKKAGKQNLYQKCLSEISLYTQNLELYNLLVEYLNLRLKMTDKPIYGVSQWKALLGKLDDVIAKNYEQSYEDVVRQSIERGYASFFPISKNYKPKQDVFSEYGEVSCEKKEEEYVDRDF